MARLKVDLHTHTGEDPKDVIHYSAYALIDRAVHLGFDAIAITNHDMVLDHPRIIAHARARGLLLIPGMEATLSGRHLVILDPSLKLNRPERRLEELPELLKDTSLVLAPHPFFPQRRSLKRRFRDILPRLDAVEFSHFYTRWINFNIQAVRAADRHSLPLVGTSDCHILREFGTTYSWVEADRNADSIIRAVKRGRIEVATHPLKTWEMAYILGKIAEIKIFHLGVRLGAREAGRDGRAGSA